MLNYSLSLNHLPRFLLVTSIVFHFVTKFWICFWSYSRFFQVIRDSLKRFGGRKTHVIMCVPEMKPTWLALYFNFFFFLYFYFSVESLQQETDFVFFSRYMRRKREKVIIKRRSELSNLCMLKVISLGWLNSFRCRYLSSN